MVFCRGKRKSVHGLLSGKKKIHLTVGLLETSAGTRTTELLGLAPTGIGDDQGLVVTGEGLLDILLGGLINELGVVGDDGAGDGLTDGVDLSNVTTTVDTDLEVELTP